MFSLFRKRSSSNHPIDFSILEVDMHSHLIPGIDDGAPDLETAIHLVEELQKIGFKKIITTPHVMSDLYPNTSETIKKGLKQLKLGLKAAGIEIPISVAAEYLMDEGFAKKVEDESLLTLGENKVLVEMSFISPPPNLKTLLFNLQLKGYSPILAHPARYQYYHNDFREYERLRDRGCSFQLNILSLTGYYGKAIKQVALKLLKNNMIEYLGTDLHNDRHLEHLQEALNSTKFKKLLEQYSFKNATL